MGSSLPSRRGAARPAPFLHAPEKSRSIFLVIFSAACVPLGAGVVFFGWRALIVAALSVTTAVATETLFARIFNAPALQRRSHAALTGLLLALTLPAIVPWYVPVTGAFLAIFLGKVIFGGVGHFLWQPALVGRLLVAVIFAPPVWATDVFHQADDTLPVLTRDRIIFGDVRDSRPAPAGQVRWNTTHSDNKADAIRMGRPCRPLRDLTEAPTEPVVAPNDTSQPAAAGTTPGKTSSAPAADPLFAPPSAADAETIEQPGRIVDALRQMPPLEDQIVGAYGGGLGETCAIAILVAGLYLVYRGYVHGQLPGLFLLAAAVTAAAAPIRNNVGDWQWWPLLAEGADAGAVYVASQLVCGEIMLAAWFLATEMTSRPVTPPAQAVFGVLCGVLAILLRMYTSAPTPVYAAVLLANTFTPLLDGIRPRVLGRRRWWQFWK